MQSIETISLRLRHHQFLGGANWLWSVLRPLYDSFIILAGRSGLVRVMNGVDPILITPRLRHHTDVYEPEVWHALMSHVQAGDTIVDVGAYIGLYTVALAKRVGRSGRVVAFEPDPSNFILLKEHVHLNGLANQVQLVQMVVGEQNRHVQFREGQQSQSHVITSESMDAIKKESITLDSFFADQRVDILKIDVEGHELEVLQGARTLLQNMTLGPRCIFIEVHPYAWADPDKSSGDLLQILREASYQVVTKENLPVTKIERYGEIIATKCV